MNIGLVLKKIRKEKKFKQIDIANAVKMSQSYYSEVESGKKGITLDILAEICKFLNITLAEFFSYEELYDESEVVLLKKDEIDSKLKDIGVEYLAVNKAIKDNGMSEKDVVKIIKTLAEIKNPKSQDNQD